MASEDMTILEFIKRGPSEEERRYWRALSNEDDLGAVIRTQTFLESYVERILRRHFLKPTIKVNVRGIAYSIRVKLIAALGEFEDDLVRSLELLERMRDEFAHDVTYQITENERQALLDSLKTHTKILYAHNMEAAFNDETGNSHLPEQTRQFRAGLEAIKTAVRMIADSDFDLREYVASFPNAG